MVSKSQYASDIEQTADGGFLISGYQYAYPQMAWLVKTDSEGNTCWKIDCDSLEVIPWTVGINEINNDNNGTFSIAPNPATEYLTIHSPETITNVAIYNTLGQLQQNSPSLRGSGGVNETQFGAKNELSVAHLASGIYLLRAYTKSGKVFTQKFVKR